MGQIKHCVFMQFKAEFDAAERKLIMQQLAGLKPLIDGFIDFSSGINYDFENKTPCNHGFVITFESQEALNHYANHPEHQKLGAKLVSMCENGADGIIVFDLEV